MLERVGGKVWRIIIIYSVEKSCKMHAFLKTGKLSGGQGSSSSTKDKSGQSGVLKKKPSLTPWVEK